MASKIDLTKATLYQYTPSLVGAIIVAVLFSLLTSAHIWKLYRHRAYYFLPFVIGGTFEVIGYCARIASHFNVHNIVAYAFQSLFILLAPALFAASIYMILARLIRSVKAESLSPVPVKWLTYTFVLGDVISFNIQLGGGGLQANGKVKNLILGRNLILAGLAVQIITFGLFMITTMIWHWRTRKITIPDTEIPYKRHLTVLYATSTLILARSIFRLIEYVGGNDGYLISHEIFLYIFDALLMLLVMIILLVWYIPGLDPAKPESRNSTIRSKEVV